MNDPVVMLFLGIAGTLIVGMAGLIVALVMRRADNQERSTEKAEQRSGATLVDMAKFEVRLENIERERERCDQLTERVVKCEAGMDEMRRVLEETRAALNRFSSAVDKVSQFEERFRTVFRLVDQLGARVAAQDQLLRQANLAA